MFLPTQLVFEFETKRQSILVILAHELFSSTALLSDFETSFISEYRAPKVFLPFNSVINGECLAKTLQNEFRYGPIRIGDVAIASDTHSRTKSAELPMVMVGAEIVVMPITGNLNSILQITRLQVQRSIVACLTKGKRRKRFLRR